MSLEINDSCRNESAPGIARREFLARLAALTGGTAVAVTILPAFEAGIESAQMVPKDDPRLETEYVEYDGPAGKIRAYQARPKGAKKLAGVVIAHENRGLNAWVEDIAWRVALEGFEAVAPDALSPVGGTPSDPAKVPELIYKLDPAANTKNYLAALAYLKTGPQASGKVAIMGFCWGGGVTNQVAVNAPDLTAAVPFYGMQPAAEEVPKIKAAMLLQYAGDDQRIDAGIPAFEEALKKAGVKYTIHMYPGAKHAFMNDTGANYNKEAAALAWKRTVEFLKAELKS